MCCKNFGIGLASLSITFFLGSMIDEFFKLKEIPEIEVVQESAVMLNENTLEKNVIPLSGNSFKNCVPKDKI